MQRYSHHPSLLSIFGCVCPVFFHALVQLSVLPIKKSVLMVGFQQSSTMSQFRQCKCADNSYKEPWLSPLAKKIATIPFMYPPYWTPRRCNKGVQQEGLLFKWAPGFFWSFWGYPPLCVPPLYLFPPLWLPWGVREGGWCCRAACHIAQ